MNRKILFGILCLILVMPCCAGYAGSIATPPSIMMPYGSDIVTEVYLSDDDLLKVIKGMVPVIGDLAKGTLKQHLGANIGAAPGQEQNVNTMLESLDLKPLSEAIEGVKSVRVLIAKYPAPKDKKDILNLFDSGVKKIGDFKRIVSDSQLGGGVTAIYAQDNNQGYIAYMYDSNKKTLYAGRLVGFLDVQKIMTWAMEIGTRYFTIQPNQTQPVQQPAQTGTDENAKPVDDAVPPVQDTPESN